MQLVVLRKFIGLALFAASFLALARGGAQTAALLAVGDATQLSEVQLAKVMAQDSSVWLSVRLQGRTRLALAIAEDAVEVAPAAHAWLRALDFATRVRVAAPPEPPSGCASLQPVELADSGLPEPQRVAAFQVASVSSELDLRRLLADAGLPVDVSSVARFTSSARVPFQVLIYDLPALGGSTRALRLADRGPPDDLPKIAISGAKSVPVSLIALAKEGVLPLRQESADPSEFPVTYRAIDQSSDYSAARGAWLAQNPTRWLNEVQASAALFAWTVLPGGGQIAPVVSRYFEQLSGAPTNPCAARVQAAHVRASVNAADFVCDGADDLAQSLTRVGFADLRLSRLFGTLDAEGAAFRVAPSVPRDPLSFATILDDGGCPEPVSLPPIAASDPPDGRTRPPVSTPPVLVSAPEDPDYAPTPSVTPVSQSEGSCSVVVFGSGQNDSCSGDSHASEPKNGSCSGDSSSSDSSSDSCTGDSSSDDSGPDSCSGDASDSRKDSSGCGKSEYDGDTCSGDSAGGNSARAKSAALGHGARIRPRPRQVRLSLLTLLAAALALPLRRLRASR